MPGPGVQVLGRQVAVARCGCSLLGPSGGVSSTAERGWGWIWGSASEKWCPHDGPPLLTSLPHPHPTASQLPQIPRLLGMLRSKSWCVAPLVARSGAAAALGLRPGHAGVRLGPPSPVLPLFAGTPQDCSRGWQRPRPRSQDLPIDSKAGHRGRGEGPHSGGLPGALCAGSPSAHGCPRLRVLVLSAEGSPGPG